MPEKYKLLVFNSTHHALQAEAVLTEQSSSIMMVPVPPEIKADCGLAVKFKAVSQADIINLIDQNNIEAAGLYQVVVKKSAKRIKQLTLEVED